MAAPVSLPGYGACSRVSVFSCRAHSRGSVENAAGIIMQYRAHSGGSVGECCPYCKPHMKIAKAFFLLLL